MAGGAVGHAPAGVGVGVGRRGVVGTQLEHVTEGLGQADRLQPVRVGLLGRAGERPAVEVGGLRVGVGVVGGPGGDRRPVVRPAWSSARSKCNESTAGSAPLTLQLVAETEVDLTATAEGQTLVGHVLVQAVVEAQAPGTGPADERRQPPPHVGPVDQPLTEDGTEQWQVELHAGDGGLAQQHPVARLQRVDAPGDQRLDVRRQDVALAAGGGVDEVGEEQRVATGPAGHAGHVAGAEATGGGGARQRSRRRPRRGGRA